MTGSKRRNGIEMVLPTPPNTSQAMEGWNLMEALQSSVWPAFPCIKVVPLAHELMCNLHCKYI